MLGEGFLRVLRYREERKFVEGKTNIKGREKESRDEGHRGVDFTATTEGQEEQTGTDACHEAPAPTGLLIPRHPANLTPGPVLDCLGDCSLLEHYPDLQVADSGPLPVLRPITPQPIVSPPITVPPQPDPKPDQGYLVMGSVNISVDVPELRTNSVLNGMLEKKLEEVYLQHLTENLARCNSDLGNSLLHGLVPPPQPDSRGPESLVVSVEETSAPFNKTVSYLDTNFSSPQLRISKNQD